jgi:hypothetical protein
MSPSSACSQLHSRCRHQISLPGIRLASMLGKGGAIPAAGPCTPTQAVAFGRAIGLGMHLVLEFLARRHVGHVRSSLARRTSSRGRRSGCRFPRCGPGRARRSDAGSGGRRCRRILRVAKGDELLAQQHQPHGIAVRLQLGGSAAGIQYCRMNSPMTVPGPTRVRSVLSCAFMNALAAVHAAMDGEARRLPGQCTDRRSRRGAA